MKAYTPHHSVHWLTCVSAQYRVLPGCFALVLLPSWCLFISVAWCICPPKAELSEVELFRNLSVLELSCLVKTARIYFSLIAITLVSGNFTFTDISIYSDSFFQESVSDEILALSSLQISTDQQHR